MPLLLPLAGLQPVLDIARVTRVSRAQPTHITEDSAQHADVAIDRPISEAQWASASKNPGSAEVSAVECVDLSTPTPITEMQETHYVKRGSISQRRSRPQRGQAR